MPNTARSISLVALVVATAVFAAACQRVSPAGIPAADPAFSQASKGPVEHSPLETSPLETSQLPGPPSELVAIASSHSRSNPKALIGAVRIVDIESLDTFIDSYANGEDYSLSQELRDQITAVPVGKVLVGGVISLGCDIPGGAVLSRRGDKIELRVDALPTAPTPECVVANMTVAIVAADILDVPGGSTSPGTLFSFETVNPNATDGPFPLELTTSDTEYLAALGQMNLNVPELPVRLPTDRRFAFLLYGCQDDWAELTVSPTRIFANLGNNRPANEQISCAAAEVYLAIFDVPAAAIPPTAELSAN